MLVNKIPTTLHCLTISIFIKKYVLAIYFSTVFSLKHYYGYLYIIFIFLYTLFQLFLITKVSTLKVYTSHTQLAKPTQIE